MKTMKISQLSFCGILCLMVTATTQSFANNAADSLSDVGSVYVCVTGQPTGNSNTRCGTGSVELSTEEFAPVGFVNRWFDGSGNVLYTAPDRSTTIWNTPSISTTTNYQVAWYRSSDNCLSSKTTVTATVYSVPTVDAGVNQTNSLTCGLTTVNLSASPSGGTWSVVSGSGGSFSSTSSNTSTFSGTAGSAYTLRWSIVSGSCTVTDDVNVTFNRNPTPANAGPDKLDASMCSVTSVALSANSPTVGTGAWSIAVDTNPGGGSFSSNSSASTTFSGGAGKTYGVVWTVSNSPCPASVDEAFVGFPRIPTGVTAGPDQDVCSTTTTVVGTSVSGGNTGSWTKFAGTGGTFGSPSNSTSSFTGNAGGTYTLRWTISNVCGSDDDDVIIKFSQPPTTANAGPDQTSTATCGKTFVTMAANTPTIGTGSWSVVSGSGGWFSTPSSPTSTFNGVSGNNYTLRWTISNGSCTPSTDDVLVNLRQAPTTPNAGTDITVCVSNRSAVTLDANTPTVGTGQWSTVSGTNPHFNDNTNPDDTFVGDPGVTYTLRWTTTLGSCTLSDDVIVKFNQKPDADAGPDQTGVSTCGAASITLAGNNPSPGTGLWTITAGAGGNVVTPSSATSSFTGTAGVTYTLRWTLTLGTCSDYDEVNIKINQNPSTPNAGPDQIDASTCGLTVVDLTANNPTVGTGHWSFEVDSAPGGTFGNEDDPTTTLTGTPGPGTYTAIWTITNGVCKLTDQVAVRFNQAAAGAIAGPDQTDAATCGLTSVMLAANTPPLLQGTGSWSVVGGGTGFSDTASPTSSFTGTAGSAYTLRWTITRGVCSSYDDVNVTFNQNPTTADAGPDMITAAGCADDAEITLAGNAPTIGTGTWTIQSGPDGDVTTPSSPTSTFTGGYEYVYALRWTISNAPCGTSGDEVLIQMHAIPDVSVSPASQTICSGSASTSITINSPGNPTADFIWTADVMNADIPAVDQPADEISGIYKNADGVNDGTVTYNIYPTLGYCTGAPATATVTIRNTPPKPTPTAPLFYGSIPASFQAYAPDGATTQWYSAASGGTAFATGNTYTNPNTSSPLTYYVSFKNQGNSCESPRTQVTAISVGSIDPASIVEETVRVSGKTTDSLVNALNNTSDKSVVVSYADGLSRTIQTIAIKGSPSQKDVIAPSEFDSYGRISKRYLPYTAEIDSITTDSITGNAVPNYQGSYVADQLDFYDDEAGDKITDDTSPWVRTIYEASPLGRVLEQGKAGSAWQPGTGHTTRMKYNLNSVSDSVRIFIPSFTIGNAVTTTLYDNNTLGRTTKTDENDNQEIVFVNGAGQTLLRMKQLNRTINGKMVDYLKTAYVYNEKGELSYIIPPAGYAKLKANSWVLTKAILDDELYQFAYDGRGRLTQKKTPGQAWNYIAYDKLNRPVLAQDGNLRRTKKWGFAKYDLQGRIVMSGLYTNNIDTTLSAIQGVLDAQYGGNGPYFETPSTIYYGYTNQSFPTVNRDNSALELLQMFYYDDYDFNGDGNVDFTYDNVHLSGLPSAARTSAIGFPTITRTRSLGTVFWIYKIVFYDAQGRPIQTQTNNHLDYLAFDKSSVVYDFEGKVVKTRNDHNGIGVTQTPQYSTGGITTGLKHKINSGTDQLAVQYQYNEIGQVVMKQLHNTGGTNFLQNVDYRYNINGWLTSINNSQLNSDSGETNDDTNDYFGMELLYNAYDAGLANDSTFNGTISAVKWKGVGADAGATGRHSYKFDYDKTDKLLGATFQKYGASSWNQEQNTLNEVMTYDHNGNILTLQRKQNLRGLSGTTVTSTAQAIDDLTYTYAKGNRLSKVVDAGNTFGFQDVGGSSTDYYYDTLGNVTSDQNKGIDTIIYNVLGKVQQITFTDGRKIKYRYDAAGTKLKMTSYATASDSTVTDYVREFVYVNGTISFFSSPGGRVMKNGSNYEYQYSIADHQGNTRVVFSSATPTPDAPTATFEGDSNDKSSLYLNVSNVVSFVGANHTPSGSKVVRMNQNYRSGPARSIKVYPGDAVDMEVYAYYESSSGYGTTNAALSTLVTYIAGGFGGVSGGAGESGSIYNGVNNALGSFGVGANQGDDVPAAYLNYIQFDQNYNVLDAGWAPVTSSSNFSKQKVSIPTKNVKEAGYMFVYLTYENQSNNYVYFDDFKVTHTKSAVVQYNEYYPFGLQTANSWTRENSSNKFLYNEGSELNTMSGLYDLPFRNYDAAVGRFFQVDPMAARDHTMSPFVYAGDSPFVGNDPSGLMVDYAHSYDNPDYVAQMWQNKIGAELGMANAYLWAEDSGMPHGGGMGSMGGMGMGYEAMLVRTGQMQLSEYVAKYGMAFGGGEAGFNAAMSTVGTPQWVDRAGYSWHKVYSVTAGDYTKDTFGWVKNEGDHQTKGNGPGENPNIQQFVNPFSFNLTFIDGRYATNVVYNETFFRALKPMKAIVWDVVNLKLNGALTIQAGTQDVNNVKILLGLAFDVARFELYNDFASRNLGNMMTNAEANNRFQGYLDASLMAFFPGFSYVAEGHTNPYAPTSVVTFVGPIITPGN